MIKNKCDTCRNTFQDCASNPVFVTEEEAKTEGVPTDTIKECDAFEPEHTPELCVLCFRTPEHCGNHLDAAGDCDGFTDEEDWNDDEDEESFEDDDY